MRAPSRLPSFATQLRHGVIRNIVLNTVREPLKPIN
jgi:hypothetical protein